MTRAMDQTPGPVRRGLDAYAEQRERAQGGEATREHQSSSVRHFYDLVTDFYEFGWGRSFHFAPRRRGERFKASLARHEHYLAQHLRAGPDTTLLDVGCGVGGPMFEIARTTGARVVGLNLSDHQIEKGERRLRRSGLGRRCAFLRGDFHRIPLPDESFDGAYAIESTCHSGDKVAVFREVARVLRPGARFVGYEWCVTPRYRADDPEHRRIREAIEFGNALPRLATFSDVTLALEKAGLEVLRWRDRADESDPGVPWYRPLGGQERSLRSLPRTPWGRRLTWRLTRVLERTRIAPAGTSEVSRLLNRAADALVQGGEAGIFTPMLYFEAQKPPRGSPGGAV